MPALDSSWTIGDRRLWLSVASAYFLNSGSEGTFGYLRHAPPLDGGRRSRIANSQHDILVPGEH
jgi:hypothetical protein